MSGSFGADDGPQGFSSLGTGSLGPGLMSILAAEDILPGSTPSYQLCKEIFSYHPIGGKLAENPINMAQSQEREISVPDGPESILIPAFKKEWKNLGKVGADRWIKDTTVLSRVYGIASVVACNRGIKPSEPLQQEELLRDDLYFSVFDPLNTAGSLVLEQDPTSPDFMKPKVIRVGSQQYHPSRVCVMMNEQPIYIQWSNSAYGFSGRSVYQRALYPLKTFLQSMLTDQLVTQKCGLLVAKVEQNTSAVNNRMLSMFGFKRTMLKQGNSGNVLNIGLKDSIESIDLKNLEGPARFARENCLKNIATAAGEPAKMLDQETLVSGFGEGSEDAKQIARRVDRMRIEMQPIYSFFDDIVMRRAWSPEFYKSVQKAYPEYKKVPYETAFYTWRRSFNATWPNLLTEPDSEKAKAEKAKFEVVVAYVAAMAPIFDPKNKAALAVWAAEQVNESKALFTGRLDIDEAALMKFKPDEDEDEDEPPVDELVRDRL